MESYSNNQKYTLEKALIESEKLKRFIANNEASNYKHAHQYLQDLEYCQRVLPNSADSLPNFKFAKKKPVEVATEQSIKPADGWELDSYKWIRQNGVFVPATEEWQPLDLSPQPATEHPRPGDFCYVYQHSDCIKRTMCPNCTALLDVTKQLAFVWLVDEDEGFANIMLTTDRIDMASDTDAILKPSETRIPYEVMVSPLCGPVFFDQLSAPIGYAGQEIIDKLFANNITGEQHFSVEKRGLPIIDDNDPRYKYELRRYRKLQKLYCFCVNKLLGED
ncbi:MAG TPA: hypothetical protein VMR51_00850 [Patescibacteria group bacterium]|nr:hypothetical protein [Patescibacteria group bacterium]